MLNHFSVERNFETTVLAEAKYDQRAFDTFSNIILDEQLELMPYEQRAKYKQLVFSLLSGLVLWLKLHVSRGDQEV